MRVGYAIYSVIMDPRCCQLFQHPHVRSAFVEMAPYATTPEAVGASLEPGRWPGTTASTSRTRLQHAAAAAGVQPRAALAPCRATPPTDCCFHGPSMDSSDVCRALGRPRRGRASSRSAACREVGKDGVQHHIGESQRRQLLSLVGKELVLAELRGMGTERGILTARRKRSSRRADDETDSMRDNAPSADSGASTSTTRGASGTIKKTSLVSAAAPCSRCACR
jgi:hypothetical protein